MPRQKPFPSKEGDLDSYFKAVVMYLTMHFSRLQLAETHITAINAALEQWKIVFPLSQNSSLRNKTIVAHKNIERDTLIRLLRSIYANIPYDLLTATDRLALGLKEKSTARSLNPVPNTTPTGKINTINRLQHIIGFTNQDGSKGKPHGVRGCQIWYKIGEPVTDFKELTYLTTATASPYVHHCDVPDTGKMMHYWLRWENTRGETGPWGVVVSATING